MRTVPLAAALLWACTALPCWSRDTDGEPGQRVFDQVFLYRGFEDRVWVADPVYHLGMVGVGASRAVYCLSPEQEAALEPFVNRLADPQAGARPRDIWWWSRIPLAALDDAPTVLVILGTEIRTLEAGTPYQPDEKPWHGEPSVCEIVSATLVAVEPLPRPWLEAWIELDGLLKEIVDRARLEPGAEKTAKLNDAAARAGAALHALTTIETPVEWRERARRYNSRAPAISLYRRGIAREWGQVLTDMLERLGIRPEPPLPDLSPLGCMHIGYDPIVEASSPVELLETIRAKCPHHPLEHWLVYQYRPQPPRIVYSWMLEGMTRVEFLQMQEIARSNLEGSSRGGDRDRERTFLDVVPIESLGVAVSMASKDELARHGILQGIRIGKRIDEGPERGLEPGDVVLTCADLYSLTVDFPARRGETWIPGAIAHLENRAQHGEPFDLEILRNGRKITVRIPGR